MTEEWVEGNLDKARGLAELGLCDHCIGRQFAKLGERLTDEERGRMLRAALDEKGEQFVKADICPLCEDIFSMVPRFAEAVAEKVNTVGSENFLVGCRVDPEQVKREKELIEKFGLSETAEPLKPELNREIGKAALPMINRRVEFKEPEVVACIDTRFADVTLDCAPLFIAGRYNKYSRESPQTRWPCRVCHGKGCPRCHGAGKMYQTSVQEEIGRIALEMAGGKEDFFHGMGREDIDARMLGTGRPFVLEISQPKRRDIDLDELERKANESILAQYHGLHFVPRAEVAEYKGSDPDKTYRAKVISDGPYDRDRVMQVVSSFKDVDLAQRTPVRVEHRRADLVRNRRIYWLKADNFTDEGFDLLLKTQSGTYVKEFVSGDGGRTDPNLSELVGAKLTVDLLDVTDIDY